MRSEAEAVRAVEAYADTVRRVCFLYLKEYSDVEDVFQDVFLKYVLNDRIFESNEHEKAWFIRVTINACKDLLKSFFRRKVTSLDDVEPSYLHDDNKDVLEAILKLPKNYRIVVYLYYYEGYTAVEIAKILRRRENTIYTWLSRAKAKLRDYLGGEWRD